MVPIAVCALICILTAAISDAMDTLQQLGGSHANTSWWPL